MNTLPKSNLSAWRARGHREDAICVQAAAASRCQQALYPHNATRAKFAALRRRSLMLVGALRPVLLDWSQHATSLLLEMSRFRRPGGAAHAASITMDTLYRHHRRRCHNTYYRRDYVHMHAGMPSLAAAPLRLQS